MFKTNVSNFCDKKLLLWHKNQLIIILEANNL